MFFGLMDDEYTDVSNKEQVSISLRWANSKEFKVHEDFIGFYEVDNTQSTTIVQTITCPHSAKSTNIEMSWPNL